MGLFELGIFIYLNVRGVNAFAFNYAVDIVDFVGFLFLLDWFLW